MSNYNSIVIIAKNIKMDREYRNVTDASEDTIRRLCNDASHQVAMATNFSYVRTSPRTNRRSVFIRRLYKC